MIQDLFIALNLMLVGYSLYIIVPKVIEILKDSSDKGLQYFTYFAILNLGISYYFLYKVVKGITND